MKCKNCGHENRQGVKFCDKCGSNLISGVCPDCGHKNRAGAQFCEECGGEITGGAGQSSSPKETSIKPSLSLAAKIAIGAAIFILLIGGGLFLLDRSTNFSLSNFLPGARSSSVEESNIAKVVYTTNPATIIEENTSITMAFKWSANTKEQVQTFIDNTTQEVMVNGNPVIAKVTYSVITPDEIKGGFTTQSTADIGNLPVGTNEVKTTVSWTQQITNGTDWFGSGTGHEKVVKEAKIVVNSLSQPHNAGGDNSQANVTDHCPAETDISAGELTWDGDYPVVNISNKLGWEPYKEAPGNPPVFSSGGNMWAKPICEIDPEDNTQMACSGVFDNPAPNKDEIGLYLPYPWSAHPDKYCVFEELNLKISETVECPPEEEIEAGEVYWQEGLAKINVVNPRGWEPYAEMPENPPFFTVNDEMYTDLGCEVDSDDNTIMVCSGPGTIKTGGMAMLLTFPWEGDYCLVVFEEVDIKNICPVNTFYCVYTSQCCSGSQQCTANGCTSESDNYGDHD